MTRLTIADVNGKNHVHKEGCADLHKGTYRTAELWSAEFTSEEALAFDLWSDMASDWEEEGTEAHKKEVMQYHADQDQIFPCVRF